MEKKKKTEISSLICSFYLSVATHQTAQTDTSLKYTFRVAGTLNKQTKTKQNKKKPNRKQTNKQKILPTINKQH